jgi:predicted nucleotidyltransferase
LKDAFVGLDISPMIKRKIVDVVRQRMPAGVSYRLFLFGSRATGQGTERSDIDLGLDAGGEVPVGVMGAIGGDLEDLPILQTVDVVDFSRVSPEFRRVAEARVEVWDER